MTESPRQPTLDVLIVGAGPTGLALAAQLRSFGVRFRIIDRNADRAHESRALAVQARSLELLQTLGLAEKLIARGNPGARLMVHFESTVVEAQLGGFAARDTRFPFVLFVSQAHTESVLIEHLEAAGVRIERRVELIDLVDEQDGVRCTLRNGDGREEPVMAQYVVGCDGAHSTVRKLADIAFEGDAYRHDFMLGDVEIDGEIAADTLHAFAGRRGIAVFFPLRQPRTWRVIAFADSAMTRLRLERSAAEAPLSTGLSLQELQAAVDRATEGAMRLRDPAWLASFRLHHRQAEHYQSGRLFLAGDAAHIHSPVGGQGMNTGIQDAWNLGWKLAMCVRGLADPELLDSYEEERWPVGRFLLRSTDRIFSAVVRSMSGGELATWIRRNVAARVLPRVFASPRMRARAFRFVSELAIDYRDSAFVTEGAPRLAAGPSAGERLPDGELTCDGERVYLQQSVVGPSLHLLLCGDLAQWDQTAVSALAAEYAPALIVRYLTRSDMPGALVDASGETLSRLGLHGSDGETAAQYVIRPDGYIAFRCAGAGLQSLMEYLSSWSEASL
jgi:2-polyprenyl-6-methoxyphenol hydroxylase-like FAD-dependent oxidoreductase